jgi:DNA polymerase III subunit epsilon
MLTLLKQWLSSAPRAQLTAAQASRLAAWQALPKPDLSRPIASTEWVVVDTETSGLSLRTDRLLAIGAVMLEGTQINLTRSFECVIAQNEISDEENIKLHRISGEEQRAGMPPVEVMLSWLEFIGKRPLVAFHAEFDAHFLGRLASQTLSLQLNKHVLWIDLVELVRVAFTLPINFRETAQGGLDHWLSELAIPVRQRHRAVCDAAAEAQLFLVLLQRLAQRAPTAAQIVTLGDYELAKVERRMRGLAN